MTKEEMKTAGILEIVERYVDCPYCNTVISDTHGNHPPIELTPGLDITCPSCEKKFKTLSTIQN